MQLATGCTDYGGAGIVELRTDAFTRSDGILHFDSTEGTVDRDGRVVFRLVPAGRYAASLDRGRSEMTIEVAGDTELPFRPVKVSLDARPRRRL
ncbi:MAG: hypothetical protein AB1486_06330 [Planctomycetota bacterium]